MHEFTRVCLYFTRRLDQVFVTPHTLVQPCLPNVSALLMLYTAYRNSQRDLSPIRRNMTAIHSTPSTKPLTPPPITDQRNLKEGEEKPRRTLNREDLSKRGLVISLQTSLDLFNYTSAYTNLRSCWGFQTNVTKRTRTHLLLTGYTITLPKCHRPHQTQRLLTLLSRS